MINFYNDICIPKDKIRIGTITKDAVFTKGGIVANKVLTGKEIDSLPYHIDPMFDIKYLNGILFYLDKDNFAIDLLHNLGKIRYPVMNQTANLCEEQKNNENIAIGENFSIESLLEYLDFPDYLNLDELRLLKKRILSNKKAIDNLALPCGYRKIDTKKTNMLDYEQEIKFNDSYYKFTGNTISDDEKCYFDKNHSNVIKQEIYPSQLFKIIVQNQSLGYDFERCKSIVKLLAMKNNKKNHRI